MMKTLTVDLGDRAYPIYIGTGLLTQGGLLEPLVQGRQVMIVSNETVAPLYLQALMTVLHGCQVESVILPDGEQYKTLVILNNVFDALLKARFDRNCIVLALGGGVVGDMAGFAAACYQRGVGFIQIPTTLLAQVDSSVGGKTGVNHALGKNMIGAFYQPQCVIADTRVLSTLDERQLRAGIAEIIKYGLIRDQAFFVWLEDNMPALLSRDEAVLAYAIERSCNNKAEIVAADECEGGIRALLNLGHTFGHAIETGMGYGSWLHGEAVAAGMCMAADLSHRLQLIDGQALGRCCDLIERAGLPTRAPASLSTERMLELMAVDKKVQDGRVRLVLLNAIGQAHVASDYDPDLLRETLAEMRA
jgi:3-dehydroquinate synthase